MIAFPVGEDGAHQIDNRTDATIRFLAISTHGQPEVTVYPDEDKSASASATRGAAACAPSSAPATPSTTTRASCPRSAR